VNELIEKDSAEEDLKEKTRTRRNE